MAKATTNVYKRVTDQIIEALENGTAPWHKSWDAGHQAGPITIPLRHTLEPYRGVNVLMLWSEAEAQGYSAPIWLTFKQAKACGAHVRRDEHGTTVVYASTFEKENDDGEMVKVPFFKGYTVFNVEQLDRMPERYSSPPTSPLSPEERLQAADTFFRQTGADIRHGGNRAYYRPSQDRIQMPQFETFESGEAYYATLAHEATHWTKHAKRLNRDFGGRRFGDEGYAVEELVAELGAAYTCATLGISAAPREDHAQYLSHWLKVLKTDTKAIFTAASHAQKATDYLMALQEEQAEAA